MKKKLALIMFMVLTPSIAWAWGERGHQIVGQMAAKSMSTIMSDDASGHETADQFLKKAFALGHVSNLPDISWRDQNKRIAKLNDNTHYFEPEHFIGSLPDDSSGLDEYVAKIRALPADYSTFKTRYEGTEDVLPGTPSARKIIKIYEFAGTAPWRAEQLYSLMLEAFQCAKSKENLDTSMEKTDDAFVHPGEDGGLSIDPPLPTYRCRSEVSRTGDLQAAFMLAGLLSHFVADMANPYHTTIDFDGYIAGNGGIHRYFETSILQVLDETLAADILVLAKQHEFRTHVLSELLCDMNQPNAVACSMIAMAAQNVLVRFSINALDENIAVLTKGSLLPWGDKPYLHPSGSLIAATRRAPEESAVTSSFRPIIVERLAVATVVLSELWKTAWISARKPNFQKQNSYASHYPLDAPFIWPDYDLDAIARSKEIKP